MTRIPGYYDIHAYQNEPLNLSLTMKNPDGSLQDISDFTEANMQIKTDADNAAVETLTVANGKITITSITSVVTLNLTQAETLAITAATYKYDLFLINTSLVNSVQMRGKFIMDRAITNE